MAAPLELSCWGGGWGLPSVHSESLVVMAYAKFSGAPLKVNVIDNTWRGSRGDVPILTTEDNIVSQPAKILSFLRKQKYNADCELSAKQGADTLAYIALLEEKLLPAVLHTFWVENDNYFTVTKPWFASRIPFPLSLILPGRMSRGALNRILLTRGEPPLYHVQEVEAQIYRDAKECLNLLSHRLGTSQFFFGDTPSTLDAYVFGFLAPLYKVRFPKVHLQEHLKQLSNLCRLCDDILNSYFRHGPGGIDGVLWWQACLSVLAYSAAEVLAYCRTTAYRLFNTASVKNERASADRSPRVAGAWVAFPSSPSAGWRSLGASRQVSVVAQHLELRMEGTKGVLGILRVLSQELTL